jgi:prevent-host-death family protein
VETTGLRELRQNASDLIRQVEAGTTFAVTVSGRPVAELGPVRNRQWRRRADLTEVFRGPADEAWAADAGTIDDGFRDPFSA